MKQNELYNKIMDAFSMMEPPFPENKQHSIGYSLARYDAMRMVREIMTTNQDEGRAG